MTTNLETRYEEWVRRYMDAWNSNDPSEIGALFTAEARYFTKPHEPPWVGRDEIVTGWLDRKDEPGDTTFEFEILVATPDLGIVKGRTHYESTGFTYSNLWEVRLGDEDRCREFVEWWMKV